MGIAQAVKQVASDVVDTAKAAASDSAKQIAKTPLELLEELLGQAPADGQTAEPKTEESTLPSPQGNPEELKQKELIDQQYKAQRQAQLHQEIQQSSKTYNEQKKKMDEQKQQADAQTKAEERFRVENLERQKQEDFALRAAKDASSAEKRVGAG